jgi:hypothetical protein
MRFSRRALSVVVIAGLAVLLVPVDLQAQGRGRGRGQGQGQGAADPGRSGSSVSVTVVFRDSDHATFRDYFIAHRITAEPLPPGIAKNVARGKPLPPGIAKRVLPAGLLAIGPKVDKDVSLAIVGNVVVATRGGVVIDVLAGVFR